MAAERDADDEDIKSLIRKSRTVLGHTRGAAERDDRVATSTHAVNHRLVAADEDIKSLANRHHRQERETPTINDPPAA